MKKFFTVVFLCFVFFVASFNNAFFQKLTSFEGCKEVSFYCSKKNQIAFADETRNGEGYIYSLDCEDVSRIYPKLQGCFGFSAKFEACAFDDIVKGVQIVKVENLEGVESFYGYVNGLSMFGFLDNKKINIQIALTAGGVVVGSPLILGAY